MGVEEPGGVNLENVMFRLMEYQSGENIDKTDAMVMMSLVNLLGIISVMNKMSLTAGGGSRQGGEDPMLPLLMSMLAQSQQPSRGGAGGINPALLMSLLGSKGQRPENALLMGLLSSMMQQPPPPAQPDRGWERNKRDDHCRPGGSDKAVESREEELGSQNRSLSWDRRLG